LWLMKGVFETCWKLLWCNAVTNSSQKAFCYDTSS
jgi:hypothetical protein